MTELERYSILGIRIHAVDYDAAVERILRAARNAQPLAVSALAVHGVMTGALDRVHRHRLNEIDLLLPDGQPVRWALNWLHKTKLRDRVYGPRLMLELCRRAAAEGLPIFLFGGDDAMLAALRRRLGESAPGLRIAGCRASRFRALTPDERRELVDEIKSSDARLVFVGIGCPRQEVFVYELRNDLSVPLVAVGAAFALHASRVPQAPPPMQRAGLEWLFRFTVEPKRLWRRYALLNPLFVLLLALQGLHVYTIDPDDRRVPQQEMRYG